MTLDDLKRAGVYEVRGLLVLKDVGIGWLTDDGFEITPEGNTHLIATQLVGDAPTKRPPGRPRKVLDSAGV